MKLAPLTLLFWLALISRGFSAPAEPVKSMRVALACPRTPMVERISQILVSRVIERCDVKAVAEGEVPLTVELAIEPGIGTEGYKISDGVKGTVRIAGNDDRGLLYGVGKFLHTSSYGGQGFTPGSWRGSPCPKCPCEGSTLRPTSTITIRSLRSKR